MAAYSGWLTSAMYFYTDIQNGLTIIHVLLRKILPYQIMQFGENFPKQESISDVRDNHACDRFSNVLDKFDIKG